MKNAVRYQPDYRTGLTASQVQERINNNLVNYNDAPPTKTIKQIILGNFLTYFNFINVILGLAIIIAGIFGKEIFHALKNCCVNGHRVGVQKKGGRLAPFSRKLLSVH